MNTGNKHLKLSEYLIMCGVGVGELAMASGLVILEKSEAQKICDRLEHDASWDKVDSAYYTLKNQISPLREPEAPAGLSVEVYRIWDALTAEASDLQSKKTSKPLSYFDNFGRIFVLEEARTLYKKILTDEGLLISFIVRNPGYLHQKLYRPQNCVQVKDAVANHTALEFFLTDKMRELLPDVFRSQFPSDYDAVSEFKTIASEFLNQLEDSNVPLRPGMDYARLREQIGDASLSEAAAGQWLSRLIDLGSPVLRVFSGFEERFTCILDFNRLRPPHEESVEPVSNQLSP